MGAVRGFFVSPKSVNPIRKIPRFEVLTVGAPFQVRTTQSTPYRSFALPLPNANSLGSLGYPARTPSLRARTSGWARLSRLCVQKAGIVHRS